MSANVFDSDIISLVNRKLSLGTRIILYDYYDEALLKMLINKIADSECNNMVVWHDFIDVSDYACSRYVTREQLNEILNVYKLYDFSDMITVISETSQYANLFYYVKEGILSNEEMIGVILMGDD